MSLNNSWRKFVSEEGNSIAHGQRPRSENTVQALQRFAKLSFSPVIIERYFVLPELKGTESSEFLAQWYSSRAVLVEAIQESLEKNLQPKDFLVSLSHTAGTSIAIVSEKGKLQGIGVDVELKSRSLSDGAIQKFTHPNDFSFGLNPLQLWLAKEACYKAIPNNEGLVLPYFHLIQYENGQGEVELRKPGHSEIHGENKKIKFCLVEEGVWSIAFSKFESKD